MILCEDCKETLSIGKCNICNKPICRYCGYLVVGHFSGKKKFSFEFSNPIPPEVKGKPKLPLLCKKCLEKIAREWRKKTNRRERLNELSKSFLEVLITQTIADKL